MSMFVAAYNLRKRQPDHPRGYRAPALGLLCAIGFVSSLAAVLIGFVPPSQLDFSAAAYVFLVGGGVVLLGVIVPLLCLWLRKPSWKTAEPAPEDAA